MLHAMSHGVHEAADRFMMCFDMPGDLPPFSFIPEDRFLL